MEREAAMSVAWDDATTRDAFTKYRRDSTRFFLFGCAVFLAGAIGAGRMSPNSPGIWSTIAACLIGLGVAVAVGGAVGISRSGLVRRTFKKNPWLDSHVDYRIATNMGNGEPALRIHPDGYGPEEIYSVPSTVWRYRSLPQGAASRFSTSKRREEQQLSLHRTGASFYWLAHLIHASAADC